MKLYGYTESSLSKESTQPERLAEVTLVATPEELKKMASFLNSAAEDMARRGRSYEHEHLADKQPGFEGSPQLIVFNPLALG